jgi:uncharacterized protein
MSHSNCQRFKAKSKKITCNLVAFVVALTLTNIPVLVMAQDFNAGMAAAQRGDYATALRQWKPLAEQGHAAAQFNLGLMYADRLGVAQSDSKAVHWWRLSAKQGFTAAQTSLAWMYANGWGVSRDLISGYMWSNIAATHGHQDAAQMRDLVASYMTPSNITEAQRRARACMEANYRGCD